MIPIYYQNIRPNSSYYLPNSAKSIPIAPGIRPTSQYSALNSSVVNVSMKPNQLSNAPPPFPLQNINNIVLSTKQPFGILSKFDTQTSISEITQQQGIVKLNVKPEYGVSGSIIKKQQEIGKQKHIVFEKGLEQLISVKQQMRDTKTIILNLLPLIEQEFSQISDAIETEFKNGIPNRSKILFHLFYERQYDAILKSLEQYQLDITTSIDIMRKRNHIKTQEFQDIIKITYNSTTYVKKLIAQFPSMGWNSSQNMVDIKALVAQAEKEPDLIQKLKILESNIHNKNYSYRERPTSKMIESVTRPIGVGIDTKLTPAFPVKIERPGTPRVI